MMHQYSTFSQPPPPLHVHTFIPSALKATAEAQDLFQLRQESVQFACGYLEAKTR